MYQVDLKNKKLEKIHSTILKNENLLERSHLQQFIFNSWDLFRRDIGFPEAILLGQEIKPHDSVGDSIDLLAFDENESCLIVIELKRDKNKLQLLQSISYAAMVATWDNQRLSEIIDAHQRQSDDLKISIDNYEINKNVKIVMIAEYYDPEVILTSDWLVANFGVDITAFSIGLHKVDDKLFLDIDQKYPLVELSETYEARRKNKQSTDDLNRMTWEDILPTLKYPFAKDAIERCKKARGNGDPKRRRFVHLLKNHDGFNLISINLRAKYLNVYTNCDDKNLAHEKIKSLFGPDIIVSDWRDGVSFNIESQEDFDKLTKWLKI